MSEKIASQLIGSDFFLVSDIVGGRFDDSPVPAYAFFFFFSGHQIAHTNYTL